jgi:inhibitor of KinA
VTVEFGNSISEDLNRKAIGISRYIRGQGFPGLIETVSAYASATVFYDPVVVRRRFPHTPDTYFAVRSVVEDAIRNFVQQDEEQKEVVEIAVNFGRQHALDLDHVAKRCKLPAEDVITIFTAGTYRVYMIGFLPGFSYLGELDERIATPRKESPRVSVPKGSIGIAGRQTGIYSYSSPGGWQIIGKTDVEMFRPEDHEPCFLKAGDAVRFFDIDKAGP